MATVGVNKSITKIPCRYLEHWRENQSPLGSGEYWPMDMEDCNHPPFEDEQKEIELEGWGACDVTCPGYEAEEVGVCSRHGEFVKRYGCEECMFEEQYIVLRPGMVKRR